MSEAGAPTDGVMRLRVLLPTALLLDETAGKVVAEAENGSFCLEPRHIDFAAALVPGVLSYFTASGEKFVALDRGVLVKCGRDVSVSTPNGVRGDDLETLESLVRERFLELDDTERRARSALARLEAGALRGLRELTEHHRA